MVGALDFRYCVRERPAVEPQGGELSNVLVYRQLDDEVRYTLAKASVVAGVPK